MSKVCSRTFQHQIKILQNLQKDDVDFEKWQEKHVLYAEIIPFLQHKLSEGMEFGHIITENLFLFKSRYIAGINNKMRIAFKGRYFEIKRVINVNEKSKYLEILGVELYDC